MSASSEDKTKSSDKPKEEEVKTEASKVKEDSEEEEGAVGPAPSSSSVEKSKEESHKTRDPIESIRFYLAEKLGFYDDTEDDKDVKVIPILTDTTLSGVVKYIKEQNVNKIVTMAGAGISTSAGIPDFRSPGSGLYHNLAKYKLPHPQAVFEIDYFQENPKPFFTLAKELYPGSFKPTICHYFIKMLHDKGLLLRHYTQNIDTLERVAGIPEEKLVEAHGTFHSSHCLNCNKQYELSWMKEKIFKDEIPKCIKCETGIIKPDIVFFGENLPHKFFSCVSKDFEECELLLILGTSLVVQPFASLIDNVPEKCPRLLINREKAGETNPIMRALNLGRGLNFDSKECRDVAWLGDCDDGCEALAHLLGFGDELRTLLEKEHKRIDEDEKEK